MKKEAQIIQIAKAETGKVYSRRKDNFWACDGNIAMSPPRDYTTDLNAAADFAKHLATLGWRCEALNGLDTTWECTFYKLESETTNLENVGSRDGFATEEHYGVGDTLALAICEAGLRALGKWVEE